MRTQLLVVHLERERGRELGYATTRMGMKCYVEIEDMNQGFDLPLQCTGLCPNN